MAGRKPAAPESMPAPPEFLARAASSLSRRWRAVLSRCGAGGAAVIGFFLLAATGSAWYVASAESPWDRGIPGKIGSGVTLTIRDTIVSGLWLGAALNTGIALVMLGLARWWARLPADKGPGAPGPAIPGGVPLRARAFWLLVLAAVAAAAWIRSPRMDHSFWNDEEQAFRKFTWGEYLPAREGGDALKFRPAGWDRALFYSVNGNNHIAHTAAAKLSHAAWRAAARPDPETFREWTARLEPFLSGLLAVVALAAWLRRAGYPLAGATAAWILAIHPWILRYGVEARGYSAMLLFIILAFACAGEALSTRRWRWWLGYGLCQCLYLLCFAGAVYLAVAMNVLLLAILLRRRDSAGMWRWLAACVIGAMIFLQMMTPTMLRIWSWIQAPHQDPFPMDYAFFRDFWSHLSLGVPWSGPFPQLHAGTDALRVAEASPARGWALRWALPALLAAGTWLAWRKSHALRCLFASLALAGGLIWLHNTASDLVFYGWYALYAAVGFAVALAFLAEGAARSRFSPAAGLAAAFVLASGYAWLTHGPRESQRHHDRHPMRQAVAEVRGEAPALDPSHDALLTGAAGSGANQIRSYDPRARWVRSPADLDQLMAESRETGKPLAIYLCGPRQLARAQPALSARLEDETLFEPGAYLPGLEEFWSFRVLRLRPGDAVP